MAVMTLTRIWKSWSSITEMDLLNYFLASAPQSPSFYTRVPSSSPRWVSLTNYLIVLTKDANSKTSKETRLCGSLLRLLPFTSTCSPLPSILAPPCARKLALRPMLLQTKPRQWQTSLPTHLSTWPGLHSTLSSVLCPLYAFYFSLTAQILSSKERLPHTLPSSILYLACTYCTSSARWRSTRLRRSRVVMSPKLAIFHLNLIKMINSKLLVPMKQEMTWNWKDQNQSCLQQWWRLSATRTTTRKWFVNLTRINTGYSSSIWSSPSLASSPLWSLMERS